MAHNIHLLDYHCSVSKRAVQKRLDAYVAIEDAGEGASGLPNPIRWIEHLCKNRDEAVEYIESHDKGWYDCLAVQYKHGRKKMWLVKIEYHT